MRRVKFIESLNVREVPLLYGEHIKYTPRCSFAFVGADAAIPMDGLVETHVAPVYHFSRAFNAARPLNEPEIEHVDTYIAYTEEVEELLAIPINTLKDELSAERNTNSIIIRENRRLEKEVARLAFISDSYELRIQEIESLGFLSRLKFVFSGSFKSLLGG